MSLRLPVSIPKSVFLTGTDTDVGKTVVTRELALALRRAGHRVLALKPVATDCRKRGGRWFSADQLEIARSHDAKTVEWLAARGLAYGEPLLGFRAPLGPVSAARLEGRRLNHRALVERLARLRDEWLAGGGTLLVEGVGGPLVPLGRGVFAADLAATLSLPAVIVARSRLGTISHTLMAWEALRGRGVSVCAVVASRTAAGSMRRDEIASLKELRGHLPRTVPLLVLGFVRRPGVGVFRLWTQGR